MITNLSTGPQSRVGDNVVSKARGGSEGQQIVSALHGSFYEQCSRGNVYLGRSASGGIAIIAPAAGGGHPTLWNPLGSGVNLSIIALELSYVSGTAAPTALEWASTAPAGASAATGAPIATATLVAATNQLVGSGNVAKGLWSPTTNTFTAAPVFFRGIGYGLKSGTAAAVTNGEQIIVRYDGDLVLAPGSALSLCSQAATTTALFQVGVVWEEIAN